MTIKKIGIIHLNQIGDFVFSLPLMKALKENYPESSIDSIIRPHLKELCENSPLVDRVLSRKSGIKYGLSLLLEIRKRRYDLIISLSNSVEGLLLTALSRAGMKIGFSNFPWDLCLDLKEKVEGHPGWYNNLKLLKRLRVDVKKNDYVGLLALPPRKEAGPWPVANYVVVSPGTSARRQIKAWEAAKFADLIVRLNEKCQLSPVLVGGKDDRDNIEQIIGLIKERGGAKINPVMNLAGKVGLRDLCYVLKDARLFVGVDSGIMHLASSLDRPVVGLFGPSDPFYVGPQNERSVSVREQLDCVPCYFKGCNSRDCMTRLDVEKVFEACKHVLSEKFRRPAA